MDIFEFFNLGNKKKHQKFVRQDFKVMSNNFPSNFSQCFTSFMRKWTGPSYGEKEISDEERGLSW